MVKSRFTIESHPFDAPPIIVNVAVLFDEVYVLPSIQITGVQEVKGVTRAPRKGIRSDPLLVMTRAITSNDPGDY